MNQTFLFLLKDLDTSLNIYKSIDGLEDGIIKVVNNYLKQWVKDNSSRKWAGKYDLDNDDAYIYKQSWFEEEEDASLIRLWFTAKDADEDLWLSNLFGYTDNVFAAFYVFDKLISYIGDKKETVSLTSNFTKLLKNHGYKRSHDSQKKYRFMKEVTLDSNLLHNALKDACPEEGLKQITDVLDELIGFEKHIDSVIKKARSL